MIIAVNIKVNGKDELDKNDNFIFETFSRIIKAQPQHNFIIISEKPADTFFEPANNITYAAIGLQGRFSANWYIWYNIKINAILKKYKADIFISYGLASLTTKVPQCIIAPHLDFMYQPETYKKTYLLFYKNYLPKVLKKSKLIIVFSEFIKAEIVKKYNTNADTIEVVYRGVNKNFHEFSYDDREIVKASYADGNEYFIYAGEIGTNKNLLNLLKAFSAFKMRQQSNMQLLIAGKKGWKYEEIIESLRLFKFKKNVKILHDISLNELIKITAAAYSFVYPARFENFPAQILQAMKSNVPVITSSIIIMHEILADAALYADAENYKEVAIKMMLLFKDEELRKVQIEKGTKQAEKFNWDNTANLLWKSMQQTFNA